LSTDLQATIERVRSTLEARPDGYTLGEFPAGLLPGTGPGDLPSGLRNVLETTDGPRGGLVTIFPAGDVAENQYYIEDHPDTYKAVANPDDYLCFGARNYEPLLVHRGTGEVWWFPDTGIPWYQSNRFERLAPDVATFVGDYLLGDGYRQMSPLPDDHWYAFLRDLGLLASAGNGREN
jgi:hypothetical protein